MRHKVKRQWPPRCYVVSSQDDAVVMAKGRLLGDVIATPIRTVDVEVGMKLLGRQAGADAVTMKC